MSKINLQLALAYLKLARPHQWNKNLILFAPLLFSAKWSFEATTTLIVAFAIFSLLSSSVYALNDVLDKKRDTLHPSKAARPIASGELSIKAGFIFSVVTMSFALISALFLDQQLANVATLYAFGALLYSLLLKHLPLIDITAIAGLLLLRLFAGAVVIDVVLSDSIIVATILLGLMLAAGKRLVEFQNYPTKPESMRPVLRYYSSKSLKILLYVFAFSSIAVYAYWVCQYQQPKVSSILVWLPLLPVIISIGRYLFLIGHNRFEEDPTKGVVADFPILISALAFAILHCWLIVTSNQQLNPTLLGSNSSVETKIELANDSTIATVTVRNIGSNAISDLSLVFPLLEKEIALASSLQPKQSMARNVLKLLPRGFDQRALGVYVVKFRDDFFKEQQQMYLLDQILAANSIVEIFSRTEGMPLNYPVNLTKDFQVKHATNEVSVKVRQIHTESQMITVEQTPRWINSFQILLAGDDRNFAVLNFIRGNQIPVEFFFWIFLACVIPILKGLSRN